MSVQTGEQNLSDEVTGGELGEGEENGEGVAKGKQSVSPPSDILWLVSHRLLRLVRCLLSSLCMCAAWDGIGDGAQSLVSAKQAFYPSAIPQALNLVWTQLSLSQEKKR